MKKRLYWTEEDKQWLVKHYPDPAVDPFEHFADRTRTAIYSMAKKLGLERTMSLNTNTGKRIQVNESEVCSRYKALNNLGEVARMYGIGMGRVSRILKKHGIQPKKNSCCDVYRESVTVAYLKGDKSVEQIARDHDLVGSTLRFRLEEWGIYDPSRTYAFVYRGGAYKRWVELYGLEEANRRREQHIDNHKRSARRGSAHHWHGHVPTDSSGWGWSGNYRGHHFRSLKELSFMIDLDRQKIGWRGAEHLGIPYQFNGVDHIYRPDFLVGQRLIEIKPKGCQTDQTVLAKKAAAEHYCLAHGLSYEMIDVQANSKAILEAWAAKEVQFEKRYEAKYVKRYVHHKG